MTIGLIGKKIGMTREFFETGISVPVTVLSIEKGRILDVTMGKFMAYHGAHMLLENDASEVWNDDFLDNNTTRYIRKFNDDHSMNFEKSDENDEDDVLYKD